MARIEHSIDVAVPVRDTYNQWTQFEEFPRFMEGVEEVRQLDDSRLHWVATVGGQRQEWDARITQQTPDRRIAWTSTTGARNAGEVDFQRLDEGNTRVTLTLEVEPSGPVEAVGTALGVPSGRVKGDLERFKSFIEERQAATGAWRGEIMDGEVVKDDHHGLRETGLSRAGSTRDDLAPGTATAADPYGIGAGSTTYDAGVATGSPAGTLDDALDDHGLASPAAREADRVR